MAKKDKEKVWVRNRIWLNPPSSFDDGWMKYYVTETHYSDEREPYYEADLMIADCSRTVSLNIDPGKKYRKQALRKLNLIRDGIDDLIQTIEAIDASEKK